jgi:hypothetical protein
VFRPWDDPWVTYPVDYESPRAPGLMVRCYVSTRDGDMTAVKRCAAVCVETTLNRLGVPQTTLEEVDDD